MKLRNARQSARRRLQRPADARTDADLAPLRADARFRALLDRLPKTAG